jgi:hypothetical protein
MNTEQRVLEGLRRLPPDRRQEVADFIESLLRQTRTEVAARSPRGLCADLGVSITAGEIDEARRAMWSTFPREVLG